MLLATIERGLLAIHGDRTSQVLSEATAIVGNKLARDSCLLILSVFIANEMDA